MSTENTRAYTLSRFIVVIVIFLTAFVLSACLFHAHATRSDKSIVPKRWFRPVVGTFEAVGIGEDFTDLSYSERGFSLDSTRTFLK